MQCKPPGALPEPLYSSLNQCDFPGTWEYQAKNFLIASSECSECDGYQSPIKVRKKLRTSAP